MRWEVMAMAKPPLQQHYCTSAQPLPLPIQRVGTNQPSDDDCCAADVDEHRLHAQLTAGIEGLILAKHIGVINSGSACPRYTRGLAEHVAYQPPSCLGVGAQPSTLQI